MAPEAKNGEPNTARPIGITAMFVLAISLGLFWFYIPKLFGFRTYTKQLVRYCGILSMAVLIFFLAGFHDSVINIAGVLGVIAMSLVIVALYKNRSYGLFALGIVCILLCILNNYIYYTEHFFYYLPIVQKISFLVFLLWFWLLDFRLYVVMKRERG
jgi:hypothetical protein